MRGRTHILSSVAALGATQLLSDKVTPHGITALIEPTSQPLMMTYGLMTLGVVIGSTLPDIDATSERFHRTITHTLWFIALMGFLWWKVYTNPTIPFHSVLNPVLFGNMLGTAFHCIEDAYSIRGVAWLWPFQQYITYPPSKEYPKGGVVVKGPRPFTPPIYRVGSKFLGLSGTVWWTLIAVPIYIHSLYTLI